MQPLPPQAIAAATAAAQSGILEQLHALWVAVSGAALVLTISTIWVIVNKVRDHMLTSVAEKARRSAHIQPLTASSLRQISTMIHELRVKYGAMRVCVFQFHNGDRFMLANHAWKVTCTHEALSNGITSILKSSQSLPVGAFIDLVEPLLDPTAPLPEGVTLLTACAAAAEQLGPDGKVLCPSGRKGHRIHHYDCYSMDSTSPQLMYNEYGVHHAFVINMIEPRHQAAIGFLAFHFGELSADRLANLHRDLCHACPVSERIQHILTSEYELYRAKLGWFRRLFTS